ncbi:MarR family winged helix-turn-helix transcriptional regulator [Erythrobacter litoralis]|uniref:Transcriptional regulator marR/emrR family protein n=1 Tax=Erythrobacter litoralis (strain HTCC2594) TaxID=314225 RepID=Q2ND50_ERYLH|nr:MarR family winged helix-turn-helix transcriptional regulator [Erythrobacter litoralis]ABC62391.1 transcriptional regulator marR/emrR family protein [Erythrobacter litoralis HTCC2594]
MASDMTHAPVLADFLPYQLSIASNAVSGRIAELYQARFELKISEWRIMAVLGEADALTQRELAARTLMDKVAVNRACKVLEDRGLVARRPNEEDGRSHHVALTGEGREIYGQIMPLARDVERQLLEPFAEEERDMLRDLLGRLREASLKIEAAGD